MVHSTHTRQAAWCSMHTFTHKAPVHDLSNLIVPTNKMYLPD